MKVSPFEFYVGFDTYILCRLGDFLSNKFAIRPHSGWVFVSHALRAQLGLKTIRLKKAISLADRFFVVVIILNGGINPEWILCDFKVSIPVLTAQFFAVNLTVLDARGNEVNFSSMIVVN